MSKKEQKINVLTYHADLGKVPKQKMNMTEY